jgi:hypothetical protein
MKIRKLAPFVSVIVVLALAALACGETAPASAPAALPTYTPYPTYTPLPQPTAIPYVAPPTVAEPKTALWGCTVQELMYVHDDYLLPVKTITETMAADFQAASSADANYPEWERVRVDSVSGLATLKAAWAGMPACAQGPMLAVEANLETALQNAALSMSAAEDGNIPLAVNYLDISVSAIQAADSAMQAVSAQIQAAYPSGTSE